MKWILSDRQTGLEWMNLNLVIDKINLITVIIFKTSKQQMNPSNQSTATNEFRFGARIHLVDWLDSLLACFLYVNLLAGGLNQTNLILNFSKSISIKLLTPAIEFWFISEFRLNLVWCPPFQPQFNFRLIPINDGLELILNWMLAGLIPFSFPLSLNSFSLGNQLNQIHCAKTLFDSMIDWNELNCGNGMGCPYDLTSVAVHEFNQNF